MFAIKQDRFWQFSSPWLGVLVAAMFCIGMLAGAYFTVLLVRP